MKEYKVVSLLSPTLRVIFVGDYNECFNFKNKMGFGYGVSKNYP